MYIDQSTDYLEHIEEDFSFENEDCNFLQKKSLLLITDEQNITQSCISFDLNDIQNVYQCSKFSKKLIENKDTAVIKVARSSLYEFSIELNSQAHELINCIHAINTMNNLAFQAANPYLKLFFKHFHMLAFFHFKNKKRHYHQIDAAIMSGVAQALDAFLLEGRSKEFKARLANYHKNYKDNRRSLRQYVDALFANHVRLLVIRLDLSYAKDEVVRQHNALCQLEGEGFSVSAVINHRKQFINMVKERFGNDLKGFCWKLEHGQDKGYHYHVVLFLDANKSSHDVTIARSLGEMWKKDITNGDGLYFNCNANTENYRSKAVGMIHENDESAKVGMDNIIDYLTKMDLYVKAFLPDGSRTMGKGIMPKPIAAGRPRRLVSSCTT